MEATTLALAKTPIEFIHHVCSAVKLVDPLIPIIAKTAATVSLSGQLNLQAILPTLLTIRDSNYCTNQSHVLISAKSVRSVSRTLQIITKELSCIETLLTNTKSQPQPLTNLCKNEVVKDKQTLNSTPKAKKEIEEIMKNTDFEEVVFNSVSDNIQTTRHSTSDFLKLFMKHKICSQRHFLHVLRQEPHLKETFMHLPYNLTNQIVAKGLTISQSTFEPITFLEKFENTVIDNSKCIKRLTGIFNEFLEIVSHNNFYNRSELLNNIFDVLLMNNNKKITLGFIRPSNTGKTFLADIITGSFNSFEIGNILPPAKDTLDTFWLSNCVYASIKRMEEFFIPTQAICNAFKQLLEGNKNQIANVKYKDNLNLPTTPTILTMNNTYKTDITKFCSNDYDAIANRCYLYILNQPLNQLKIFPFLDLIRQHKHQILCHLYQRYRNLHPKPQFSAELDELRGYSGDEE